MMTAAPASESRRLAQPHGRLSRSAVGLSVVSGAAFVAAFAAIAIAYAVGKGSAVEDTTLALMLVLIMAAGALGSLAAFVLAIVAAVTRERWALLWLPRSIFPAIVLFVVLGEAFWWE